MAATYIGPTATGSTVTSRGLNHDYFKFSNIAIPLGPFKTAMHAI